VDRSICDAEGGPQGLRRPDQAPPFATQIAENPPPGVRKFVTCPW
jgi:hypothetical protein